MMKKWIFAAGAGIGYVLGTRAGRQRYEAMKTKARQVLERPDVREATDALQAEANRLYDEGRQLVRDRVRTLRDRNGNDTGTDAGLDYEPRTDPLTTSTTYTGSTRPQPISPTSPTSSGSTPTT